MIQEYGPIRPLTSGVAAMEVAKLWCGLARWRDMGEQYGRRGLGGGSLSTGGCLQGWECRNGDHDRKRRRRQVLAGGRDIWHNRVGRALQEAGRGAG